MRVLAFPAFKNRDLNPYQFLLYSEMCYKSVKVDEFSLKNVVLKRYEVIHVHWPESNKLRKSFTIGLLYAAILISLLKYAKLRGAHIVWTVHNELPHEVKHPKLTKKFFSIFKKLVDGFIFLNKASHDNLFPELNCQTDKLGAVIPHGHYRGFYKNNFNQRQARAKLDIDENKKIILYFGQIRPYKGIDTLIRVFNSSKLEDTILLICGASSDSNSEFTSQLLESSSDSVRFDLRFIPDDQLQIYFNAADLVVLPYKQILNSGTIFLALSYSKPVLIPEFEGLKELQKLFGKNWVFTFEPDSFNEQNLVETIGQINTNPNEQLDLSVINWDTIAEKTIRFYRNCIAKNG
jgi:beta-1,4-mannosyltransferase